MKEIRSVVGRFPLNGFSCVAVAGRGHVGFLGPNSLISEGCSETVSIYRGVRCSELNCCGNLQGVTLVGGAAFEFAKILHTHARVASREDCVCGEPESVDLITCCGFCGCNSWAVLSRCLPLTV